MTGPEFTASFSVRLAISPHSASMARLHYICIDWPMRRAVAAGPAASMARGSKKTSVSGSRPDCGMGSIRP